MARIAQRKILDGLRRYRTRTCPPEVAHARDSEQRDQFDTQRPSVQARQHEEFTLLMNAVADLPPDIRDIITLRHMQGLTFEAISEQLDIPVTTCRRRWTDGLQLLEVRLRSIL